MGFFVWVLQIMGQAQGKKDHIQLQGMPQQEWTQILHCGRDSLQQLLGIQECSTLLVRN